MTREEALSACLERGWTRAMCEEELDASMVNGAYCDGDVVITADGRRCVSADVEARVRKARASQPIAHAPTSATSTESSFPSWVLPAGVALVGVVAVVVLLKRR